MPTNVLQKNQSYPELGYRIDGGGIAFDLETGQPLSRQEVDARIAQAEAVDPSSQDYADREKKRGGLAGVWDRNDHIIKPILATAATVAGGGLLNKFLGGGGMPSPGSTNGGDGPSSMPNGGGGNFLSKLIPSLGGGDENGGGGMSAKDWLAAISGGVGAGLDYKTAQSALEEAKNQFARRQGQSELSTAVGAQDRLNRAPMADNAQALLKARMGSAPTTFAPRDYTRGPMTAQTMAAPATGGPQDALASARTAAANYQPGQGGVDTSALEILKKRMFQNAKVGV